MSRKKRKNERLCRNCNSNPVSPRRKYCDICKKERPWLRKTRNMEFKKRCADYLGSKCEICEYASCIQAMTFHHRDPSKKNFNISGKYRMPWNKVVKELRKCALLCSRCHSEVHAGMHPDLITTDNTRSQRALET